MNKVAIDTNVLVAIIDSRDNWHSKAKTLIEQLQQEQAAELIYFDCVLNETVSVLARRLEEQKRSEEFSRLLESMQTRIPETIISWITPDIRILYGEILALVAQTSGKLNFHDALIALKCRELKIESLLSFDKDFDQVEWITRIF